MHAVVCEPLLLVCVDLHVCTVPCLLLEATYTCMWHVMLSYGGHLCVVCF